MATLDNGQLDMVRQVLAGEVQFDTVNYPAGVNWTKAQINAAIQAIEDVFESATLQNAINNAINNATAPLVLPAAVKRKLVRHWLRSRFERGN